MQHVAVSNGTLNVYAQGKGLPLLFVHGFPLNHSMWQPQIDAFTKKNRVIVPDLRGFGESTVTAGTVTMEDMADDLHGILHAAMVDRPVVYCGLSMGGYIAWQFFRKYRAQLAALILCDTRATPDTPDVAAGRHKLAETVMTDGASAAEVFAPQVDVGQNDRALARSRRQRSLPNRAQQAGRHRRRAARHGRAARLQRGSRPNRRADAGHLRPGRPGDAARGNAADDRRDPARSVCADPQCGTPLAAGKSRRGQRGHQSLLDFAGPLISLERRPA